MNAKRTYNPAVGYGDVIPQTTLGKALDMITSICDIGLFALSAGILRSGFFEEVSRARRQPVSCPHYGRPLDGTQEGK
ncbi:two pore domain potassium channel family protein [Candidatus Bipolaricaulota bacterium]|nr:two pore domain potassium channel family protein [Candidatus Bipolaricaulota bacterium]